MARQKDQKMRFNDSELQLFKALFAENEDLLFIIRKVFLQVPLSITEEKILSDAMSEPAHALLKKTFLPELDADSPLFQLSDMRLGLNVDMKGLSPEQAWPLILTKEMEIDYIEQRVEALKGEKKRDALKLSSMTKDLRGAGQEQAFIRITARNYLLSYIDSNLAQIKFLAGESKETVEETKARLAKNSAK